MEELAMHHARSPLAPSAALAARNLFAGLAALAALAGCGDAPKNDSAPASADAIGVGDFAAAPTPMTVEDVADEMEDFDAHENAVKAVGAHLAELALERFHGLRLQGSSPIIPGCENEGMFLDDTITAAGPDLSFHLRMDLGPCMRKSFEGMLEIDELAAGADAVFETSCPGADFSALDGKKITEIMGDGSVDAFDASALGACDKTNNTLTRRMKVRVDLSLKGHVSSKSSGTTQGIAVQTDVKSAQMAANGDACQFTTVDGKVTVGDCAVYDSVATTGGAQDDGASASTSSGKRPAGFGLLATSGAEVKIMKATLTGATGSVGGAYYAAGDIPVSINDWTGRVVLDGTSTPRYELRSGTQSLSGYVGRTRHDAPTKPSTQPPETEDPGTERPTPSAYQIPELGLSAEAQVYSVGMYEPDQTTGEVVVDVDVADHPVILVLSSYDAARFKLNVAAATKVELVILSSYDGSTVQGVPAGAKLLATSYVSAFSYGDTKPLTAKFPPFDGAYQDDSEQTYELRYLDGKWQCTDTPATYQVHEWTSTQEIVKRITGKPVSGALGAYTGTTFKVDASTAGAKLPAARDSGSCYKNADGTLTMGGGAF
jgi:hypothetical protein